MNELLRKGVIADSDGLGLLVYADYLDENGLDSSMWREPSRFLGKMVWNGKGGDGNGNCNRGGFSGGGSGGGGFGGTALHHGGGGDTGGGYGDGSYNDGDGSGGFIHLSDSEKPIIV